MKRALVLGSALCVWDDIDKALELSEFEGVVAAKGAGIHWPGRLNSWVSLHPERFPKDVAARRKKGYPDAAELVGHVGSSPTGITKVPYKFEGQNTSGSSGLFAVKRAFELGFDLVVLCGVPLDQSGGKLDYGRRWLGSPSFQKGFEQAMPHLKDRVRSMSGWTRGLLGYPTAEWLKGERADA